MHPRKHALLAAMVATLLVTPVLFVFAQDGSPRRGEKELINVLNSDAELFEKAKACQDLAVVGTARAVPALAAQLENEKLAHYARFALEPIPDPSASLYHR